MGPMMMAEIMYAGYRTASNERNVRGGPLPEWHTLDEDNQKAWARAAEVVRSPKLSDLADRPLVDAFARLQLALGDPKLQVAEGQTVEIALLDLAIEAVAAGGISKAA